MDTGTEGREVVKIGNKGLWLIRSFEQCRLEAYLPTPDDVPTIGFGHTKGVKLGDICTPKEADDLLANDLAWVEECINERVDVPLTQNQFDALASFVFNLGCGNFAASTLLKLLNLGNFTAVPAQFLRWNKQGKNVLPGLTRRREAESELFQARV